MPRSNPSGTTLPGRRICDTPSSACWPECPEAKYTGHCSWSSSQNTAQDDLPKRFGGRFGENIAKVKDYVVPRRYKRYSVHADLPIYRFLYCIHRIVGSFLIAANLPQKCLKFTLFSLVLSPYRCRTCANPVSTPAILRRLTFQ